MHLSVTSKVATSTKAPHPPVLHLYKYTHIHIHKGRNGFSPNYCNMHFAKGQRRIIIVVLLVLLPSHRVHTLGHIYAIPSQLFLSLCVIPIGFSFHNMASNLFCKACFILDSPTTYIFVLNPHGRSETYIQLSTTRLRKEGQEGTRISQRHTHSHLYTHEYAGYRRKGCV